MIWVTIGMSTRGCGTQPRRAREGLVGEGMSKSRQEGPVGGIVGGMASTEKQVEQSKGKRQHAEPGEMLVGLPCWIIGS